MSQARILLRIAMLVLLIVGSAEIWVECMCDDDVIIIEGELTAKSEIPTLKDISPYREALVVFEYRVRKRIKGKFSGKIIRVTHWAIYDEQPQEVIKREIGSKKEMELRSLNQLKELESIYISDTLEIEPDLPFYHDIGQNIRLNQSVKERYDYRCSLSDTMPAFWMPKDQLKLVALGDSRGMRACGRNSFAMKKTA